MSNTASINYEKQYSLLVLAGDQTASTIKETMQQSLINNDQLSKQFGEIHVIADISQVQKIDLGSQAAAAKSIKSSSFDKFAIVGATPLNRHIIEAVVALSGKQSQIKLFDTRTQAEAWFAAKPQ